MYSGWIVSGAARGVMEKKGTGNLFATKWVHMKHYGLILWIPGFVEFPEKVILYTHTSNLGMHFSLESHPNRKISELWVYNFI